MSVCHIKNYTKGNLLISCVEHIMDPSMKPLMDISYFSVRLQSLNVIINPIKVQLICIKIHIYYFIELFLLLS